jgi:hypothetical protein
VDVPPPEQPPLPASNSLHIFGNLGAQWVKPSLTERLDAFLQAAAAGAAPPLSRAEAMLRYLKSLGDDRANSQLLEADLGYLCFAGDMCPLIYDSASDAWFVYDQYWKTTKNSMAGARTHFQTTLLETVKEVHRLAVLENCFIAVQAVDGQQPKKHTRMIFLEEYEKHLGNREGADRLLRESCMYFNKDVNFDTNPNILQLQNGVVDLKLNAFRHGKPSDMCSLSSPIVVPRQWLLDASVIDAASLPLRQSAWDLMWSMFKRTGDFHPLDAFEEVGDQDLNNFNFLLKVMARLLEGRPLCRLIVLTNPRGRNSKGVLEKVFISVWGTYHVSVRSTVFQSDKRNENEHSAAETNRRGKRVACANETTTAPWSNGEFKKKNSTDPTSARGCGANDVERIVRTETFVFGMNDPPVWEVVPKGSEEDRHTIIYTPNKYINKGEAPSSPRTFVKDVKLEARIVEPEFALGFLMVLLDIRVQVANSGEDLDEIIGEGTPTSRLWIKRWMEFWTKGTMSLQTTAQISTDTLCDGKILVSLKDFHRRYQGKSPVFQWVVEKDTQIEGTRTQRWANVLRMLDSGGRFAATLATVGTAKTRRSEDQKVVDVAKFDLDIYLVMFDSTVVFGEMVKYSYDVSSKVARQGSDEHMRCGKPALTERETLYHLTDVFNLSALRSRRGAGIAVTGERRPDELGSSSR